MSLPGPHPKDDWAWVRIVALCRGVVGDDQHWGTNPCWSLSKLPQISCIQRNNNGVHQISPYTFEFIVLLLTKPLPIREDLGKIERGPI
jgi:hypothetical protein